MVSLLDLKRFQAAALVVLSTQLARLRGAYEFASPEGGWRSIDAEHFQLLYKQQIVPLAVICEKLDLRFSCAYIQRIRQQAEECKSINHKDLKTLLENLQERIEDELSKELLFHVPANRARFYNYSLEPSSFPRSASEIIAAGRCLAFGEGTAAVFHLMRAIDMGLRSVAASLAISYTASNWKGVGDAIEKRMSAKYQEKATDWKQKEPMYASILVDIQAISRAHRNPVMHELDQKYTETEAEYLFTVTEHFIEHLASSGMKELS